MSPDLLRSKKFFAAVVAFVVMLYGALQGWPPEQILTVASPFLTYILGQGFADFGKEAFKGGRQWRYTENDQTDLPGE